MASDWQRRFGLLYNSWAEFNETYEASPLHVCIFERIAKDQDGRPDLWLSEILKVKMTFDFSSTKETGHIPPQQQPLGHKQQLCEFSVYLLLVVFRIMLLKRYFSHITTWKQEITNLWNSSGEAGDQSPDLLLRKRSLTTRPSTCFLF